MSEYEFLVPELEWKLVRHQRQEQTEATEFDQNQNQNRNEQRDANNRNGSSQSHVQEQQQQQEHCSISFHQNHHSSVPISMSMKNNIYEIEELTWENGQLAMHGHGSSVLPAAAPPRPIWSSSDTLESIVHQASSSSLKHARFQADDNIVPMKNPVINPTRANKGSSSGELKPDRIVVQSNSSLTKSENVVPVLKKRARSESAPFGTVTNNLLSASCSYRTDRDETRTKNMDRSMCGSASAPFYREDHDPTMMTWASFESPWSFKINRSLDEDSAASLGGSENQDEDQETKTEAGRCHSSKWSRAAAVHNQSERRRRDRINQKMKTLQRLVPNARQTDKASMLDEVIDYLKQLQAQVQMMNTMRNININSLPQITMMPIGMTPQQQLQMSLLSRMSAGGVGFGLGMGMGVIDINSMARVPAQTQALSPLLHPASAAATAFASTPQLMVTPAHAASSAQASSSAGNNASFHMPDPYCALLAQKMNIELYDKMAALYRRQTTTPPSNTNEAKRD